MLYRFNKDITDCDHDLIQRLVFFPQVIIIDHVNALLKAEV